MPVKTKTAAAKAGKATATIIDFSNVKERGNFNPKNIEPGDYAATITKVEQTESRAGDDMWVFSIVLDDVPRAVYPHYCVLTDNQYWKIKALFTAAGINVGQRKVKVDPNKLVGKQIAVGMEDDEYEGRMKSVIVDVFPVDDLDGATDDSDPEEDEIEEEPAPKRRSKKAPEPEEDEEEDEEDEEDEEEEEPAPRKRAAKKAPARKKRPVDDDEDEDEDELEIDEL
jgi:hypothetical protein